MSRKKFYTNRKKHIQQKKKRCLLKRERNIRSERVSPINSFCSIKAELSFTPLPPGWAISKPAQQQQPKASDPICIHYLENLQGNPTVSYSITISHDLTYKVNSFNRNNLPLPKSITLSCNVNTILSLLTYITSLKHCTGNGDEEFLNLAPCGKEFRNRQGQIIAQLEEMPNGQSTTIRHVNCSFLLEYPGRCANCAKYRKSLFALNSKSKKSLATCTSSSSSAVNIYTNHRWLTKQQLSMQITGLRTTLSQRDRTIEKLKRKLESDNTFVGIDHTTHDDLQTIMENHHRAIMDAHPEGSFQRLFWESQYKASQQASSTHFRWHPTMIKWCLFLRHKSSKAYELLRKTGIINLPSQRTLRDYSHFYKSTPGFSIDLDRQLINDSKLETLEEYQKHVCLLGDEMYIKEDLVYNKNTGELIGFCDIGEINNYLLRLEQDYHKDDGNSTEKVDGQMAKTVMVLMARGLFTDFTFPYASFPSANLTGEQLIPLFYEAIMRLELCGFRVTCITLDGNSVNRKFFKLIADSTLPTEIKYKCKNPMSLNGRELFLFSDPPHLIKTARNCLANPKRNMEFRGKAISWKYIQQLYEIKTETTGLTTLPKLRYEHIYLNNFSKMRVDLAAQVLSSTVSKALREFIKDNAAEETALFIEYFDKFFDILNVKNYTEAYMKRKLNKSPYRCGNDERLKWLENTFLPWLKKWEDETKAIGKRWKLKADERKRLLLSPETLLGVRMTAYAFIDLVKYIFTIQGVKSFLSERISQDPLEKFFGRQRQRGGVNENPTARGFSEQPGTKGSQFN